MFRQRLDKRRRIKGLKALLIPCAIFFFLLVISACYVLLSISWERFAQYDNDNIYNDGRVEDFVHYEEPIDSNIVRKKHLNKENSLDFPTDNSSRLLDLQNFKYIYNFDNLRDPHTFCSPPKGFYKLLVVLIVSPEENYKSREIIRKTYGSLSSYRRWMFRTIFVIGLDSKSLEVRRALHKESQMYGDIIVAKLSGKPKSKVYIHLMGYKWAVNHCKKAEFFLKAMDNIYIDLFNVVNIISQSFFIRHSEPSVLLCNQQSLVQVNHDLVTRKEFPGDVYPSHCSHEAVIMSFDLARKLYLAATTSKVFWLETVWMTGILREKLGIRITNIKNKYLTLKFRRVNLQRWAFATNRTIIWAFIVLPKMDTVRDDVIRLWENSISVYSRNSYKLNSK